MVEETKKVEVKKPAEKVNPIAKEAIAPVAEANPSKIEESKKQVAERKEEDARRVPSHNELMQSLRKQTKKRVEVMADTPKMQTKPRSFPDPTFKAK